MQSTTWLFVQAEEADGCSEVAWRIVYQVNGNSQIMQISQSSLTLQVNSVGDHQLTTRGIMNFQDIEIN